MHFALVNIYRVPIKYKNIIDKKYYFDKVKLNYLPIKLIKKESVLPELKLNMGDEVKVFTEHGRKSVTGVIQDVGRHGFKLSDGSSYNSWDNGRKYLVEKTGSDFYRNAVTEHSADVAIDILKGKDALNHPEIKAALDACLKVLGEEEVQNRHRILCAMGASTSQDVAVYRKIRFRKG